MKYHSLHIKQNKGSAMVMVVSLILLLISFGTISLLAGLTNAKMGIKYSNWSKEYYMVDKNAEEKVEIIDSILGDAEKATREYFANEYYKNSVHPNMSNNIAVVSQNAQDILNAKWSQLVYGPSLVPADSHIPTDSDDKIVYVIDQNKYSAKLKPFIDDAFNKMYFYFANYLLNYYKSTSGSYYNDFNNNLNPTSDYSNIIINYINNEFKSDYLSSSVRDDWSIDVKNNKCISVSIDVAKAAAQGKHVLVNLDIKVPSYTSSVQTKKIPLRGNPIWANAITAGRSIFFNDTSSNATRISGDIFAADMDETGKDAEGKDITYISEGNNDGVVNNGANVELYGNIYSNGDVHNYKDSGKIAVHPYSDSGYTIPKNFKSNMYEMSSQFINTPDNTNIDLHNYIEGNELIGHIPLIYNDINGGNVYCNNLSVEPGIKNTSIDVDGNVFTKDDVQMDGESSSINIHKNYIGINSMANDNMDPNGSSAVINNMPGSSSITLNGNFLVPGVAYIKFDGIDDGTGKITTLKDGIYYSTAESMSAIANDSFTLNAFSAVTDPINDTFTNYVYEDKSEPGNNNFYNFYLYNKQDINSAIKHLLDFFNNGGQNTFTSNISLPGRYPDNISGYTLGADMIKDNNGNNNILKNSNFHITNNNSDADVIAYDYNNLKTTLKTIMDYKTLNLGTDKSAVQDKANVFGNFVDKSAVTEGGNNSFYYLTPDSSTGKCTFTLNPNTNTMGIIYAAGDLEIQGTGNFYGTIISEGNVTIDQNPGIYYDENVITNILLNFQDVRDFFKKGEIGKTVYADAYSINSGTRNASYIKRYSITQWKEEQDQMVTTQQP
ncbi:MAG: DUF2572 family protein [Bacillota bacterium]|nr:DUF2572 family protein [Bacillota bacterium]